MFFSASTDRSTPSPARMTPDSPVASSLLVRYWADLASWCTAFREMSLEVLPLADTLSANAPLVSTFTALLKKLEDIRLVLEV